MQYRLGDCPDGAAFYERLRAQVSRVPGVRTAALSGSGFPPLAGSRQSVEIADRLPEADEIALVQLVSAEYMPALRIPLRSGRIWSTVDTARATSVAVINEAMARRFWPGADPLGKRLRLPDFKSTNRYLLAAPGNVSTDWLEVIGVVGDALNRGLKEPILPSIYVPYTFLMDDGVSVATRSQGDPLRVERTVREQVKSVDPAFVVGRVRTAEKDLNDIGWARERFVAGLLLGFGGFALALAAMGLYSVVSYSVSRQLKEFGIRIALGANRVNVLHAALRPPMTAIAAGLVTGLALSIASNKIIARWSIGNLSDPIVLWIVTLVVLAAAAGAALIPANRAASIQPAGALRVD